MKTTEKLIAVFTLSILIAVSCTKNTDNTSVSSVVSENCFRPEKIQFLSLDSVPVSANLYQSNKNAPVILLCHQARFNKFEYTGIAKKLMEKGYTCLAIDQRSGGGMVEESNETFLEAKKRNKPVEFLDAEQDIIAAIIFANKKFGQKVILWGSSYSSALALYNAIENDQVSAVIAFSPGNYFAKEKGSLIEKMANFSKPMFVTSSKEEANEIAVLLSSMKLNHLQQQFVPETAGFHGSKALWITSEGNEAYWTALLNFLELLKSPV
jgi:dienelactone hydrolase